MMSGAVGTAVMSFATAMPDRSISSAISPRTLEKTMGLWPRRARLMARSRTTTSVPVHPVRQTFVMRIRSARLAEIFDPPRDFRGLADRDDRQIARCRGDGRATGNDT